ncbi:DUF1501 domain-containing protein [Gaetbulibacter aestuarii]|uniref:DUF1501 domain-containing protein n=1 Tax=Gaetbulibacter aestuarii TaxID=1502358 RepID=A0ABW7MV55_9FLAO
MKRRHFIRLSAAASAAALTPFQLQAALGSSLPYLDCDLSNRKLVLVFLQGGNDGVNTVIPLDQYDTYRNLRPTLGIPDSGTHKYITLDSTLDENQQMGLHPALTSFKTLYDQEKLRIFQSCGYPGVNGSHFRGTDLYLSGNDGESNANNDSSGWVGRFLENQHPDLLEESYPLAVELGSNVNSLAFIPNSNKGISMNINKQDLEGFYSVISGFGGDAPTNIPNTDNGDQIRYIIGADGLSNKYAKAITDAFNAGQNATSNYQDNSIANQFKTVARLISGGLKSKVFMVHARGYDTHHNQAQGSGDTTGAHSTLLTELSQAIETFLNDLESQQLADNVVGQTFSEFGRKAKENNNLGTDHGKVGPMFVFGKPLAGGVSGTNPDLSEANSENNFQLNTFQFDYRQIFGTLLQDFLGANDTVVDATFFDYVNNESFTNGKIDGLIEDDLNAYLNCSSLSTADPEAIIKRWKIYPNPVRSGSIVWINGIKTASSVEVKIYNIQGRLLSKSVEPVTDGKASVSTMADKSSGLYIVKINDGKTKESHKIVKI